MAADPERHYHLLCDYPKRERRPAEKDHYRDHKLCGEKFVRRK
jgi:hypothetical protein